MSDKKTPQSSYSGPVVVDPLTRIEGISASKWKWKTARSRTPAAAAPCSAVWKTS